MYLEHEVNFLGRGLGLHVCITRTRDAAKLGESLQKNACLIGQEWLCNKHETGVDNIAAQRR